MYDRYKRDPDGFRRLVELLETTPLKRRQELVAAGLKEDADYTNAAMDHILTFQVVMALPQMELTEVLAGLKAKSVAHAILGLPEAERERLLACVQRAKVVEVNSYLDTTPSPIELGQAKKEAIIKARELERSGVLTVKRIPRNFGAKDAKEVRKKRGAGQAEALPLAKDLFGGDEPLSDNLFGESSELASDMIGKKKAG